ncbi:MAG: imidazole glycerol phosphate synthase subunit HisF [Bacteroidales bacterium]|nr:imidazole glycerol phosphate synthase subunit HisF [Bacteroidales bacterium]
MFRPRIIPVLLIKGDGLVKTIKFEDPNYIGDPMNAVRIFNEFEADELVILDINATTENRGIPNDIVRRIAEEAFMPFAVGGGINNIEQIREILNMGVEKVVINTASVKNPNIISEAASIFGGQSIIVAIDVKINTQGIKKVYISCGKEETDLDPVEHAKKVEMLGAGEILINSIDNDGTMLGFDIDLIKSISESVSIPTIACGGAGCLNDFSDAINFGRASAVAAGSYFVYIGNNRAVLINYPDNEDFEEIFNNE